MSTKIGAQNVDLKNLHGPYLGQKKPGNTPELFAPGLVSTEENREYGISISKDGLEIYFTRRYPEGKNEIYSYKYESGNWILQDFPLADNWEGDDFEPNLSPSGKRLYFNSDIPDNNPWAKNKSSVLYVVKEGTEWSEPVLLDAPILETGSMFMTQSNSGMLYFTGFNPEMGIYSSKFTGETLEQPIYLPHNINNFRNSAHPYIAPDESYLIFDYNINDFNGERNLMISFRNGGSWTDPVNIEKYMGLERYSYIPFVSFDQKYFFFSSGGNIYWRNADFIYDLMPQK